MAVAWIKIEHSMPDKPEVSQLAEALGIDHDSAVGKLVRFWIWADAQSVDGNAINVTSSFLDRLTNCPGFAAGLLKVGWLDNRNGRFSVPRFDRHNGQTAKARALTKDRVKRSRGTNAKRKCNDENVTSSSLSSDSYSWIEDLIKGTKFNNSQVLKALTDWCAHFSQKTNRRMDRVKLENDLMEADRNGWDAIKLERCIRFSISVDAKRLVDSDDDFSKRHPNGSGKQPTIGAGQSFDKDARKRDPTIGKF